MDDIGLIEELGLQEVSRKTHIEVRFLEYMINKDFGKLNKTNTMGFIKILKREYNMDLSEWIEEFESYWGTHTKEVIYQHQGPVFAKDNQESKSKKPILLFLILILIIGAGFGAWKFGGLEYIKTLTAKLSDTNSTEKTYVKSEAIEEVNTKLKKLEIEENKSNDETTSDNLNIIEVTEDTNQTENITEEVKPIQEEETKEIIKVEEENTNDAEITDVIENLEDTKIQDEKKMLITPKTEDKNTTDENTTNTDNLDSQDLKEKLEEKKDIINKKAYINPRSKIWLGIINLDTKKRNQYLQRKKITIDLSKPQIIITGHGNLVLIDQTGEKTTSKSRSRKFYYAGDGTIMEIDEHEFKSYNGGKSW